MLVTNLKLQRAAARKGYAVGAFNADSFLVAEAILHAAMAHKVPIIVQTSVGAVEHGGADYFASMVRGMAKHLPIPISLHLDHGDTFERAKECIQAGYTSVMIDASRLPLAENIALTQKVVRYAHKHHVSVEGEVGQIYGAEDLDSESAQYAASLTKVADAEQFVYATKVDALAVSIGNAHGIYKGRPKIDFPRLKAIRKALKTPLVLHGGSGIPAADIRKAISIGISKINVNTEIRIAFGTALRHFLKGNPKALPIYQILNPSLAAMQKLIDEKIKLFYGLR